MSAPAPAPGTTPHPDYELGELWESGKSGPSGKQRTEAAERESASDGPHTPVQIHAHEQLEDSPGVVTHVSLPGPRYGLRLHRCDPPQPPRRPQGKKCRIEVWRAYLPWTRLLYVIGNPRACHAWIEVFHCNGAWSRYEVWSTPDSRGLHIRTFYLGPTESPDVLTVRRGEPLGSLEDPELVEAVEAQCPSTGRVDPEVCRCIPRSAATYRFKKEYDLIGSNSNTFIAQLLSACGLGAVRGKLGRCAYGAEYNVDLHDADSWDIMRSFWERQRHREGQSPYTRLYPPGPR